MQQRIVRILGLLLCAVLAAHLQATDFWLAKQHREWSEKECRSLLEDSPWASTYALADTVIELFETERTARGREANPRIVYSVQFLSALPIRQAEVQMARLQESYQNMSPEQQPSLDGVLIY